MLSRQNEINMFRSYSGVYKYGDATLTPDDSERYSIKNNDNRLLLKVVHKGDNDQKEINISKTDGIAAFFFGEMYNFNALAKIVGYRGDHNKTLSLSGLCCLLYKKYGNNFAQHINGMFSLVLRDQFKDILIIAVDRFGSARPIYYSITSKLIFSSHLKALLSNNDIAIDIDCESLALFLKYSYIPFPKTILKNVKKLGPGEMLLCNGNCCSIQRYIDFTIEKKKYSEEEAIFRYTNILKESVSNRLEIDRGQNVGIFLSGGLDSSAIVALASDLNKHEFETFSVGFDDPAVDERPYARIAAEYYGVPFNDYVFGGSEIENLPEILYFLEEPFIENGLFLTYAGFKSISKRADVVLTGNCSDQLFGTGGFAGGRPIAFRYLLEKLHMLSLFNKSKHLTRAPFFNKDNPFFKFKVLLRRSTNYNDWFFWGFDDHEIANLCRFKLPSSTFDVFLNKVNTHSKSFEEYYQHSVIHQDIEHYACQNVLVKSHRMAELFDVYCRDPFLDYNVVDFILSLELPLKRKGGLYDYLKNKTRSKYLHQLAMKKILPKRILEKPKQGGFINMAKLIDNSKRRNMIYRFILNSDVLKEYFNKKNIERVINQYEHILQNDIYWMSHRDAAAGKIMNLLVLSLWFDLFINNRTINASAGKLSEVISH